MRIVRRGRAFDRSEDAHRLHHGRGSAGVVGCARCRMRRVEVRAEDHNLMSEIRARDLADDVERVKLAVFVVEPGLDVEFDRDR